MAYNLYFGQQFDQLACKTLHISKCGKSLEYTILFDIILVPVLLQRQLRSISYFSMICLLSTLVSIIMTIIIEIKIFNAAPEDLGKYGVKASDVAEYNYINWSKIPFFMATFMTIYEGNSSLLNIYAEVDKPTDFNTSLLITFTVLIVACAGFGTFSYLTFGSAI